MNRLLGTALLLSFVSAQPPTSLAAQEDRSAGYPADSVRYAPSLIPDRIILTWDGDPARSQAVTWRSTFDPLRQQVGAQIARMDAGLDFLQAPAVVLATSTPLETEMGLAYYHTARFTDLEPATRYAYRVGDGEHWSEWFQFTTAWDQPERFSFIYLGDAQNLIKSLWSRVIRAAVRAAPDARFIIHAGDLVDLPESDIEWGEWHAAASWINGTMPSIPAAGNHEYVLVSEEELHADGEGGSSEGGEEVWRLSKYWHPQFPLPQHGPPGLEGTVYYLDYSNARFIVLNSNERHEEQAVWLERVLAENTLPWTIVTFHHPLFSAAGGRDYPELRNIWGPVFHRYAVDLVLQGHDHAYARGSMSPNPERGPDAWVTPGATMYVVSVSGPKLYRMQREAWMTRAAGGTPMYQIITIDGNRLHFETRTALDEVYDAFELHKQRGRHNRIVDRIPRNLPERP